MRRGYEARRPRRACLAAVGRRRRERRGLDCCPYTADRRSAMHERPLGVPTNWWSWLAVAALIAAAVAIGSLPIVGRLGFAGDDWHFLSAFFFAPDGALSTRYQAALNDGLANRPGHVLYLAALYGLFGLAPLGWHVTNHAVI